MAWTAPMTAVDNDYFSADQYNANIRDNFLETAPAKATTSGGFFAATGTNAIAERIGATAAVAPPSESTTSTSYTNLTTPGPAVTVTTGVLAILSYSCDMAAGAVNGYATATVEISGATTVAAGLLYAIEHQGMPTGSVNMRLGATFLVPLTAGSNTFTMKYKSDAGSGIFSRREISVLPL